MSTRTFTASTLAITAFASLVGACLTDASDTDPVEIDTETSYMYTDEKIEKVVDVKEGCKLEDIKQKEQHGEKPLFKPPGIFQNNGAAAAVDGVEQGNAGLLGDKGSLKALHGGPGSTGNPLPTGDQIGQMNKPVIDSICFAASAGANGCSVLAVECAQTGGDKGAAGGSVIACTGTVYVQKGKEYCDGQWVGCDGKAIQPIPQKIGGLELTQGSGAPKGGDDDWYSKCDGGDEPTPTTEEPPTTTQPPTTPTEPVPTAPQPWLVY